MEGVIEYVFSASTVSVYVPLIHTVCRLGMNYLFSPPAAEKELANLGKQFTEKYILHRDVRIKFEKVEDSGLLVGRILHPQGDIAYEVVKNGYAKL